MTKKPTPAQAAAELLQRRDVRRSLAAFARSRGYVPAAHHRLLIAELEALANGETDFLLVEMPPGSAKSTYINYLFPAWFLARSPGSDVLTASHSSELAERWGRKTRNLMIESGLTLGTALSADSTAAYRWSTTAGSEYYAVGVGVGIMGFRAALGIIDDPFGSREDAESKRIRDRVWEWYTNDFSSRLRPGAKRVIMHQRFHEDDLAGRLVTQLELIGKPYRRLKLRAESLGPDDDPLGREAGALLWDDPSGYDYGRFLRDRKAELGGDPRTWSALYQQEPVPDTGDYFKREWLIPVEVIPPRESLRLYGGSDYAVTANGGDYTAHGVLGLDSDGNPWLVDVWHRQASSEEWVAALCDLVLKWHPLGWAEETGQIKSGVGPFLEREMRTRHAYVARQQFPTRGDKAVRAQSFRGLIATRGLRIPAQAPWRPDFEIELLRFPAGVHDDQVDMCLAEGTMIRMADGTDKPIEAIRVGDSVATPIGPCEVSASAVTADAATVFRVTTGDGRELIATGSHPVHVERKGFVRVDELCMMDQLTLEPSCSAEHQKAKLSSIADIAIAATQAARTSLTDAIFMELSRVEGSFTGMCGKMLTALSRLGMTSTTLTVTQAIMPSKISPVSPRQSTGESILLSARASLGNWFTWIVCDPRPLNGTIAQRASNGIARTVSVLGTVAKRLKRRAYLVALNLTPTNRMRCFVLAGANSEALAAEDQREVDMSPQAKQSSANAAIASSSPNGQSAPHIARKRAGCVIAIEVLSAPARVRNLTVSRAHVFYANGILTHNCGLIGQLLDTMIAAPRPRVEKPPRHDGYRVAERDTYDTLTI